MKIDQVSDDLYIKIKNNTIFNMNVEFFNNYDNFLLILQYTTYLKQN